MRNLLFVGLFLFAGVVLAGPREDGLFISHVHRGGGARERPDNTLETFLWCWGNGSALECDCRCTADGVGIMFHDDDLRRTPRGIPADWKEFTVDRIWRGAEYRIRVTNPKGVEKGVAEIRLNGETVDSIPVQAPGSVSEIEVIMG